MLICLYVLPVTMPRYAITTSDSYYYTNCLKDVSSVLSVPNPGNSTYSDGYPGAAWYCDIMNFCGFPKNSALANTKACPLYMVSFVRDCQSI